MTDALSILDARPQSLSADPETFVRFKTVVCQNKSEFERANRVAAIVLRPGRDFWLLFSEDEEFGSRYGVEVVSESLRRHGLLPPVVFAPMAVPGSTVSTK